MSRHALVVAAALILAAGNAAARDEAVPDRRIVTTAGQDFYGADIGTILETNFETCLEICLGNPGCNALTFNAKTNACFLKSGVERREPFADAISAQMLPTSSAIVRRATLRRGDIPFVSDGLVARASALAAALGGRFSVDERSSDDRMIEGAGAERLGDHADAARHYAAAAVLTDGADAWRGLARAWALQRARNGVERRLLRADALSAAINAYLRSEGDAARAASLAALAEALEGGGHGRGMIDALRLAQSMDPRAEVRDRLAYARSRYGFRVVGHRVDSDAANARVCVEFSEPLAEAGIDYAPYLKVRGGEALPIEAEDSQLCVDGLAHGRRYDLAIREGLPSRDGETLQASARIEAYVRDRSPSVRFLGRAYVLPRRADAAIPVVTVNVQEVRLAIHRVGERNLLPALQRELLEATLSDWGEKEIAETVGEIVWEGSAEVSGDASRQVNADVTTALPIGEAIAAFEPGVYVMTARLPDDREPWERAATQWFVVTDLGLASMTGADGLHAFVRSLASAAPVGGATVRLVARNNDVLGLGVANAAGYVRFEPGLIRGAGGSAPAMLTVETGRDFAFLDLERPGFDLTDRGVDGRPAPGPVDVFATTDRGVYRPGEVVHLTALARDGTANAILGMPLVAVVTRPDGVEYHRASLADQGAGGRAHSMRLDRGAPRGAWRLGLHVDPEAPPVVQLSFLVEDHVPERMDLNLDAPEGLVRRDVAMDVAVNVRHLYGAPGANLTVAGEVRVTESESLPGFPGFRFGLHDEQIEPLSEHLPEVVTDADGDAVLRLSLPEFSGFTKPLKMTAIVSVVDGSGRPVERTLSRPLAPDSIRLGIRPLFEGQAEEGSLARFEVIAVGPDGTRAPLERVGWIVSRLRRDWQWYELDGRWGHEALTVRERVADGAVTLAADGPVIVEAPVDWGRYELKLVNLGGESGVATLEFDAGWYAGGAISDTPEILDVGLDKERYAIGETVRLRLNPRDGGRALIAVVDNRLIEMHAVDVAPGETSVDLTVTEDWGAGAYIVATLVRPTDAAVGRNPSRALGLAWAEIDPGDRALEVAFVTPDEVAPRGPLPVDLRVANLAPGEQAFATIAAVDVGILNLTGFRSPDPAKHYFGQRALGMEMRDLYGRLIDGMQGVRGRMRSGGDAAAQRDVPPPTEDLVAHFSGVVTVGPDGAARVDFDLPDFNGTVRLMAIAWTARAVGGAEMDVQVRDPIIVSAATPRFLAPGDRTRVLIEIAHATGPAGDVDVAFESLDGGIRLDGSDGRRTIRLEEGGIERMSVPIVAAEIGDPRLLIRVTTPTGAELTKTLRLPVRLNDPEISRRNAISLAANGGRLIVNRDTFAGLLPGTARASLTLGPIARFDAAGLMMALDRYRYGCTEQIVSQTLPLLYLDDVAAAIGLTRSEPAADRIQDAIRRILRNQSSSGAFGLWRPDRGDLWLDAYVTDFLARARTQGHAVPDVAFEMALDNLVSKLSYAPDFKLGGEDIAYALMVLARQGLASIGDLRYFADARAHDLGTPMAKAQLGAALAYHGEIGRADTMFRLAEAQALGAHENDDGWRLDYGSQLRDGAALLALAAEARPASIDADRLVDAVAAHDRSRTSTQEDAWMLMATRALADRAVEGLRIDGAPVDGAMVRVFDDAPTDDVVIENAGGAAIRAVLTTVGVPTDPPEPGGAGYRIERTYYSMQGDPVSPQTVARNVRLVAVVTVTSETARAARLMIDDPLPAGFEIDNPALLRSGAIDALSWLDVTTDTRSVEFRSDRFLAAVDLGRRGAVRVAYVVRAVSPGSFHHPAATVEDMYRPDFRAWTGAGRVTVAGR